MQAMVKIKLKPITMSFSIMPMVNTLKNIKTQKGTPGGCFWLLYMFTTLWVCASLDPTIIDWLWYCCLALSSIGQEEVEWRLSSICGASVTCRACSWCAFPLCRTYVERCRRTASGTGPDPWSWWTSPGKTDDGCCFTTLNQFRFCFMILMNIAAGVGTDDSFVSFYFTILVDIAPGVTINIR